MTKEMNSTRLTTQMLKSLGLSVVLAGSVVVGATSASATETISSDLVIDSAANSKTYADGFTTSTNEVKLTMTNGGLMKLSNNTASSATGDIIITGSGKVRSGIIGVDSSGNLSTSNGALTIGASGSESTVSLTAGGYIAVNSLTLNGGTTSVSGKLSENPDATTIADWDLGSQLFGADTVTVDGDAVVNLFDGGIMKVANGGSMNIEGDARVNVMNGGLISTSGSDLTIEDAHLTVEKGGVVRGQEWDGTNKKWNTATGSYMAVTNNGASSAGKLTVQSGGLVDLGQGALDVNNGSVTTDYLVAYKSGVNADRDIAQIYKDTLPTTGIFANGIAIQNGTVTVNKDVYIGADLDGDADGTGGSATTYGYLGVGANGILNVAGDVFGTHGILGMGDNTAVVNIAGTYHVGTTANSAQAMKTSEAGSGTLTTGAIDLKNNDGHSITNIVVDSNSTAKLKLVINGLGAQNSFFNGSEIEVTSDGLLTLGTGANTAKGGKYDGTMKMSGSGTDAILKVDGGTWTLKELELTTTKANNKLEVNNGRLNITDITLGTAGTEGADTLVGGFGKLQVKYDQVYNGSTATALDKVTVDGGGELILTGKDKISLTDYKTLITALITNGSSGLGTLTLEGTQIDIVADDKVTGTDNLDGSKLSNGMNVGDYKVQSTAADATNGGVKGVTSGGLVISGTTENTPLNIKIDSGTLGLSAADGGAFITTDKTGVKTNVAVEGGKTLALKGAGSLKGDVTLTGGGTLNVQGAGGTFVEKVIATDGSVGVGNGASLTTDQLSLGNSSSALTLNGGGTMIAKELTAASGSKLTIGDDASRGSLVADKVTLDGASMFLDPAWKDGVALEGASNATLKFTKDTASGKDAVDGLVTVGQNSWVSLGTDNQNWFTSAFASSALNWSENDITAALAIYAPQLLVDTKGGLTVDGSIDEAKYNTGVGIAAAGDLKLGAQSLLVVNAAGLDGKAALTSGKSAVGAVSIADDAKLLVLDAASGSSIKILENFNSTSADTFESENILFNNFLLKAKSDATWNSNNLTVDAEFNTIAYDALRAAGLSHNAGQLVVNYTGRGSIAGNQFMENALSTLYHGNSALSMATSLESGLDTARAVDAMGSGLATVGANSASTMARAMGQNVNGVTAGSAQSGLTIGLWGMPVYTAEKLDKGRISDTGLRVQADTDVFGGIIGADLTFGADQNFRVGAAFNVGAGETTSEALNVSSKNEFDYVGGALYASTMFDKFTLAGIVGYTSISNDIKQTQLGGQLHSKPSADLWNMGLEASYTFNVAGWNLVPSLGVEWLHYSQDSYTTMLNNSAVVNVASASANRVNLPIGIKLNKSFPFGTGNFIPEVRARVIPAFGSEMNANVSLPGIAGANATLNGINQDSLTGEVGLGLTVNLTPDFSFAAGYDFQMSKSRSSHNINAMLRLKF